MTKRKKRRIFKRNKNKFFYLCLVACFIIGLITVLLLTVFPKPLKKNQLPPYEEVFPNHSILNQDIGKIDQAIYRFLSYEKISNKNIAFATLEPRQDKKHNWEFTELGVKFKNNEDLPSISKDFEEMLSKLKSNILYRKEVVSEKAIAYHVFVDKFYTHKVSFFKEDKEEIIVSKLPKIAIIIDDLGYDTAILQDLEEIDLPLTLSVLPSAPYEKEICALAKRKGWELLVHVPMEPKNYPDLNPGANTLFIHMTDEQITEMIDKYLKELPEVKGVNNHMGSAFTENEAKMIAVMSEIKKRKLFYIDSRTTPQTVAARVAKKMGVPTASRSVFLDNDLSTEAIQLQLERLIGIAKQKNEAIAIGHPHHQTITVLEHYLPGLKDQVQVVPASEMVY